MKLINFLNYWISDYQKYFDELGNIDKLNIFNKLVSEFSNGKGDKSKYIIKGLKDNFLIILRKLDWDSKVLNVSTARIEYLLIKKKEIDNSFIYNQILKQIEEFLNYQQIEFLIFRLVNDNKFFNNYLKQYGFKIVDILETFVLSKEKFLNFNISYDNKNIIKGTQGDIDIVKNIAKNSFLNSRLYKDKNIPKNKADFFYEKLSEYLIKENDFFSVYRCNSEIVGFCIGTIDKYNRNLGYLWLIAVDKKYRGKKIGKNLLYHFLKNFFEKVSYIEVSTQRENLVSRNLYLSAGFEKKTEIITFHYWR